jgi:predicted PurR-regulated permease PerM
VLAIFAGLVNFIPVVGPVITLIVAGAVAALQSTPKLIGVVIFYIVYHNAENIFVNPRVMRRAVHISAAAVVAAIIVGDAFVGIVGMLIAVPTAVLVKALIEEYVQSRPARTPEIALHDRAS